MKLIMSYNEISPLSFSAVTNKGRKTSKVKDKNENPLEDKVKKIS